MGRSFDSILGEFTPEFYSLRRLAQRLHEVLFPLRNGVIWTGTDGALEDAHRLYNVIIDAFEEAMRF
jgi:hypothetical protein